MMRCALIVILTAFLAAAACGGSGGGGTTPNPTPNPTPTPSPTPTSPYRFAFEYRGPSGIVGDDASAVQLADGQIRAYFLSEGVRSALSRTGETFEVESGIRRPCCVGLIRVVPTPSGWRMYNAAIGAGTITSAFSADGLSFAAEAGVRISGADVGAPQISTGALIRLTDGRLRMYFSTFQSPAPPGGTALEKIYSATSSDGLSWTLDVGARTGPGTAVSGSAFHPAALLNPNGSVTLFYFRNSDRSIYYATAVDGLTFGTEQRVAIPGFEQNDPDVLELSDGRILLLTARVDGPPPRPATVYDVSIVTRTASLTPGLERLDSVLPVALPSAHSVRDRILRAERAFSAGAENDVPEARAVWAINRALESAGAREWMTTSVDQFRMHTPRRDNRPSPVMSPLDAVVAAASLMRRKMQDPDFQTTPRDWVDRQLSRAASPSSRRSLEPWWFVPSRPTGLELKFIAPVRESIGWQLADESSDASRFAHRFLDLLGIAR